MSENTSTSDKLVHEYSEISSNVRHYSSLRFAMFSVYFAVIAGIASVAFHFVEPEKTSVLEPWLVARCAGVFFTIIFFILETVVNRILTHEVSILQKLENALGYSELATMPRARIFNSRNATYSLYIVMGVFWFVTIWFR